MKVRILLAGLLLWAGIGLLSAKELKVLMIGNSFSASVGKNLPQVVHSFPGHSLELTGVHIGGCSLERHAQNLKLAEADPKKGRYGVMVWNSAKPDKPVKSADTLNNMLRKQQYDIVTIQQASRASWDWKTYEPFVDELIAYIRKCQPKAEIVIQQTWSYRVDSPNLKKWKIDQNQMYEGLRDAYAKLAGKYKFRVIPTGDAVQLFRKYTPVKFQPVASFEKYQYPDAPSNAGDVVGNTAWRKAKETGKLVLSADTAHLNAFGGHYLQACVWFGFLFGESPEKITWTPETLPPETAALIRKCAQEALAGYKQVK